MGIVSGKPKEEGEGIMGREGEVKITRYNMPWCKYGRALIDHVQAPPVFMCIPINIYQ